MHVDQNRVFFLFLCQLSLFHSFLPRAPEGVLLIRAVSPTTPQGSVSQLDSLIHIHRTQVQRHTFTKSGLLQHVHTHPYAYHLAHTHTHTHSHTLSSCYLFDISSLKGSSLKMHLSLHLPLFSIPSNSICHLYLRLPLSLTLSLTAPLSWQVI